MKKRYRKIEDVLHAPISDVLSPDTIEKTDRVLRSTRLEDSIYTDLRTGDDSLEQTERTAAEKLASFPALSRDVFQFFYSLLPRRNDESTLSVAARKFNTPILDQITQSDDFPTLKTICEGRELPAYEAAAEFITRTAGELDSLLSNIGGNKNTLNTLDKLEQAEEQARCKLLTLAIQMQDYGGHDPQLEQSVVDAANQVDSKRRQVEAVGKIIDASTAANKDDLTDSVAQAVSAAVEKAEEVQSIIGAWSDDPSKLEKNEVNTGLLDLVRKSDVLKEISKYLGRFREIFAQGKRNGYAYGRGEKYSLELGNNISRALTSELAMLASPETLPLFLQKYQRRQIKQYQRREPIYKGMGDMICCLDESISTAGAPAAWGKAVALTLLEIASDSGRSFALIHFASSGQFRTDLFRPGEYTMQDKLSAAETFLNGGTDFETPMSEALRLMKEEGFENADIVFITDGECELSQEYLDSLSQEQIAHRFKVTGILLDKGEPDMDFSLKQFCQDIYRTSQLLGDDIVRELVSKRV